MPHPGEGFRHLQGLDQLGLLAFGGLAGRDIANVVVKLDARVMKDTKYLAMLHYETNGNTSYDFGPDNTADDGPALTAAGDIYMTEIKTAM